MKNQNCIKSVYATGGKAINEDDMLIVLKIISIIWFYADAANVSRKLLMVIVLILAEINVPGSMTNITAARRN